MKNNIKNLIAQVKVLNEKHDAIRKINGENFNIFSILNLETDEVKTHSYYQVFKNGQKITIFYDL